jgi:hypothetical protein
MENVPLLEDMIWGEVAYFEAQRDFGITLIFIRMNAFWKGGWSHPLLMGLL